MRKILVVTRSSSAVGELNYLLPNDKVRRCCRDYHFKGEVNDWKPDLIVSDGTCKTRDEDGKSVGIYFDAAPYAQTKKIPVRSLFWFLFWARFENFFSANARMFTH